MLRSGPSVSTGSVKGDLEAIMLKALDANPERRYADANAFGDDIDRHLNQQPVMAKTPTFMYAIGKIARRNRTALSAVTACLLVLVAAAIFAGYEKSKADAEVRDALEYESRKTEVFENILRRMSVSSVAAQISKEDLDGPGRDQCDADRTLTDVQPDLHALGRRSGHDGREESGHRHRTGHHACTLCMACEPARGSTGHRETAASLGATARPTGPPDPRKDPWLRRDGRVKPRTAREGARVLCDQEAHPCRDRGPGSPQGGMVRAQQQLGLTGKTRPA